MWKHPYFVGVALVIAAALTAGAGIPPDAQAVIDRLEKEERRVGDLYARYRVVIPEDPDEPGYLWYHGEWGYDEGQEFFDVTLRQIERGKKPVTQRFVVTFDGAEMRILREQEDQDWAGGSIASLDPNNFRGFPTPHTLLGHDVQSLGRKPVYKALRDAAEVKLRPGRELVGGRECIVLEATGTERTADGQTFDAVVWLDPERQMRVVQLENFINDSDGRRWLFTLVTNIRHELIDDLWLPVSGEYHRFSATTKKADAGGGSLWNIEPMVPYRLITVEEYEADPQLDPSRFTIVFAHGTGVFNAFKQDGFTVGDEREEAEAPAPRAPGAAALSTRPAHARVVQPVQPLAAAEPGTARGARLLYSLAAGLVVALVVGSVILARKKGIRL